MDIRNVKIADDVNVNFGCVFDGRGAEIIVERNADIAPQVNIWTMQHKIESSNHEFESFPVKIEENVWIANRSIVLPGSILAKNSVVAAGTTFKGVLCEGEVVMNGALRKLNKERRLYDGFQLRGVRRFR